MTSAAAARPGVLVTRPEPDATALAHVLGAAGWRAVRAPMLAVQRLDRARATDLIGCAAVVFTSRHAVGFTVADLPALRGADAPAIYAVGAKTAETARAAGLGRVVEGPGDAAGLLHLMIADLGRGAGRILIARGREIAVDVGAALSAQGIAVIERAVYAADPLALTPAARSEIVDAGVGAALFFSGRTTEAFLDAAAGLDLSRVAAVCNSERTAAPARAAEAFAEIRVAAAPTVAATLAALGPPFQAADAAPRGAAR